MSSDPRTTGVYTLPRRDALPLLERRDLERLAACELLERPDVALGPRRIAQAHRRRGRRGVGAQRTVADEAARQDALHRGQRSEEHTSELQSRQYLVCRLLLEKNY